eukprot:gene3418-8291_t
MEKAGKTTIKMSSIEDEDCVPCSFESPKSTELPPRLDFSIPKSFPFETLRVRMPVILTKAIDSLHQHVGNHITKNNHSKAMESIGLLTKLKYEMQTGKFMRKLQDGGGDCNVWNAALESLQLKHDGEARWWSVPWLFSECYMYRRIQEAVLLGPFTNFDPFKNSKQSSFSASKNRIGIVTDQVVAMSYSYYMQAENIFGATRDSFNINMSNFASNANLFYYMQTGELAKVVHNLSTCQKEKLQSFEILLQFSLWGNKSDLSLMADFDGSQNIDHLQAGTEDHLNELKEYILCDHTLQLWSLVSTLEKGLVHIVLDNAGIEVFADLCLGHWFVNAGHAAKVVFHGKAYPWFVSDVTNDDLEWMLQELAAYKEGSAEQTLAKHWKDLFSSGTFEYQAHPFWTYPHEFSSMPRLASELYCQLQKSHLAIFKGDLNYRKLVADRRWDYSTPLTNALCGFLPCPLAALRTLKSNPLVGVTKDVVEKAKQRDDAWNVNGTTAVIQASSTVKDHPASCNCSECLWGLFCEEATHFNTRSGQTDNIMITSVHYICPTSTSRAGEFANAVHKFRSVALSSVHKTQRPKRKVAAELRNVWESIGGMMLEQKVRHYVNKESLPLLLSFPLCSSLVVQGFVELEFRCDPEEDALSIYGTCTAIGVPLKGPRPTINMTFSIQSHQFGRNRCPEGYYLRGIEYKGSLFELMCEEVVGATTSHTQSSPQMYFVNKPVIMKPFPIGILTFMNPFILNQPQLTAFLLQTRPVMRLFFLSLHHGE